MKLLSTISRANTLILIPQSWEFNLFCVRKSTHIKLWSEVQEDGYFYNMVCFLDEDNIVAYPNLDCSILFQPENCIKVIQISPCEKIVCNPCNAQHKYFYSNLHISNISIEPDKLKNLDTAAPITLNLTPDSDLMTTEYAQPSTHEPKTFMYPLFSSLTDGWSEERLERQLCIFADNFYTVRTIEQDCCYR